MNLTRVAKFATVGTINTAIDLSLFAVLTHVFRWDVIAANVVSYSSGVLSSFLMNKFWTFEDHTPLSSSVRPFLRFCLINLIGLLLSTTLVALLSRILPKITAKVVSVGGVFCWNYVMSKLWVYRSVESKV